MWLLIAKAAIAGVVIIAVSELAGRMPRLGAIILSLPVVSVLAFTMTWLNTRQIQVVGALARETLMLIPLGFIFFAPLALCDKLGLSFWTALSLAVGLTLTVVSLWIWLGPKV